MRDLKPIEMDAVSGGDFDFDLNKKILTKTKTSSR
jgi:hypothetical protein